MDKLDGLVDAKNEEHLAYMGRVLGHLEGAVDALKSAAAEGLRVNDAALPRRLAPLRAGIERIMVAIYLGDDDVE